MNYFLNIDRELQRKVRAYIKIKGNFLYEGTHVEYFIESNKGLLFKERAIDKIHHSGFVKSENKKIFYQYWLIDKNKPTLFFIHGNAENSSTHPLLIYTCLKNGFNFFSFDQEGHGDSDGIRGTFSSFDQYIQHTDNLLSLCIKKLKEKADNPQIILNGFSVGGLVSLYYLLSAYSNKLKKNWQRNTKYIRKTILFAPYLRNHKRIMSRSNEFLLRVVPFKFSRVKLMRKDSQIKILNEDETFYENMYKNLSDNTAFLSRRWKDKRIHRLNSLYWLQSTIRAQYKVWQMSNNADKKKLPPIYFFVNEGDLVVDNERTKDICKRLLPNSNIMIQTGFFHEFLDYEGKKGEVFHKKFLETIKK